MQLFDFEDKGFS